MQTNTTANGDAAALSRNQACESSISSWNSASAAHAATITSKPTIPIPYSVSTNYVYDFSVSTLLYVRNYSGPVSTLCDGIPRASGKAFSIVSITTSTQAILSTSFAFESVSPSPTCSYDWRGCELELRQQPGVLPGCAQTGVDFNNANCILPTGAQCRANVGSVGVYYWPSSKDPSALCSSTGVGGGVVTPTSMPSVPVTAVVDGRTFTSPSIYVSFSTIDAAPFCIPTYTGAVVAFPPESISWVPSSAYLGMEECQQNTANSINAILRPDKCSTIYDDDYFPYLALPTDPALLAPLDPAYTNCTQLLWRKYVTDPPIPLTTAGALLPSGGAPATTTAANGDPDEPVTTSAAAPVTETTAPFAPSTAPPAGSPPTATSAPNDGNGQNAGGSNSQPTGAADPPSSFDPSQGGSNGNDPSNTDPADSDPWDNLGFMISGIWGGAQPTAADPAPTTTGQGGENADPPANNNNNNNNGGGQQQQQPPPNPGSNNNNGNGNGATGLPIVETIAPGGNNDDPNTQAQPTFVPVVVTIATVLASPVPAPAANPNGGQGENGGNSNASGSVAIGTQTLAPGQTTIIASHTVVVAPTGGALVVDGTTAPLYTTTSAAAPAPLATAGGSAVAVDPSDPSGGVLVGSQPLAAGASTTVNGVPVVVPARGGAVVVGGQTYAFPAAAALPGSTTVGGQAGQTTVPFSAIAGDTSAATGAIITLADGAETLTATPVGRGTVVLGGSTTLSVGGPAATIRGSVVSAAADGLVVADAGGLGGLIAGGLGAAIGDDSYEYADGSESRWRPSVDCICIRIRHSDERWGGGGGGDDDDDSGQRSESV
ncbi:hypothetical protein SLS57_000863 [Botryosphaeria dothidea]